MEADNPVLKKAKHNEIKSNIVKRETIYIPVHIDRQFDVNLQRIKLPACMMEQEIVDAIRHNDVVVVTGDTGCGKSTQVPQFLYENGFCFENYTVGVTQVRRVACIALYRQVSLELNSDNLVGYQYRFNKGYNRKLCRIKFMTDGILLQEIKEDIMCSRYSVIIIDEAHERNLNCDLLIGILSRVVKLRRERYESGESDLPPLKLVIMSATIRAEDFLNSKVFGGDVAHCHIPTEFKRNTIHFSRRSVSDYVIDAYDKILKIHRRLPPGSVLVFLTGKEELFRLKRLLSPLEKIRKCDDPSLENPTELQTTNEGSDEPADDDPIFELDSDSDSDEETTNESNTELDTTIPHVPSEQLDAQSKDTVDSITSCADNNENAIEESHNNQLPHLIDGDTVIDEANGNWAEPICTSSDNTTDSVPPIDQFTTINDTTAIDSEDDNDDIAEKEYKVELGVLSKSYKRLSDNKWHGAGRGTGRLKVIVMHASQTMDTQMAAFELPTDAERVVILSTNVAETALTLPNIRYVVDSGKEKRRLDDIQRGLSRFVICDISKASANQRSGRAGRVGKGHCYRQYTSSVFDTLFDENSPTEISNCNLESTILLLCTMGIENPYDFRFLTPPPFDNIRSAMTVLAVLGAIEVPTMRVVDRYSLHNEITTNPFKIPASYPYKSSYEVLKDLRVARITQLGHYLSVLPINPRYGKMVYVILSKNPTSSAMHCALCVISCLSFGAGNLVCPQLPHDIQQRKPLPSLRSDIELFVWICCRYTMISGKQQRSEYCKSYGINERLLCEVLQQAEQLYRVTGSLLGDRFNINIDWNKPLETPDRATKLMIEAAIVECMVDKIAVQVQCLSGEGSDHAQNAYRTASILASLKDAFLPRPYSRHKPECVVFGGLIGDEKLKLQDVLPTDAPTLCTLKSPLIFANVIETKPAPRYNPVSDIVEAFCQKIYAPLNYSLGVSRATLNLEHPLATRVFAQQFCFGCIFTVLSRYNQLLEVNSNDFLLPTKASEPLGVLLTTLRRFAISTRERFVKKHRKDPTFLMNEYRNLLRKSTFDVHEFEELYHSLSRD
ncbi:Helicase conserved C-terminal domain family protein [Babesia bovis T2Bo]|uniref:RNA helicase n=1 Tax=Babesia bovis TaxID=5865 RepID=A7AS66_BABBO|nr:Helicase conserved C-terminal domain family protein [Babesia bovis T2Bo]EDO07385.1 Helicase conserved C-terminal domain family protein [Babesia bovis T2Bo]|eukprot:XP_001610953.1 RNA helicase [Babesia bovis T2Bo]